MWGALNENIILNNLKHKGIEDYVIEDCMSKDGHIPVKGNEIIYVYAFWTDDRNILREGVLFKSKDNSFLYEYINRYNVGFSSLVKYESDVFITVNKQPINPDTPFFTRYYKITY